MMPDAGAQSCSAPPVGVVLGVAPAILEWGAPLRDSDYEKLLDGSGIRREWLDRAGFRRVDDADGKAAMGQQGGGNYAGILIPYILPGQTQPCEYALRRDVPDIEYNAEGKSKERRKYMFPVGRGNRLYFPPSVTPEALADKTVPLLIVEGAKKALACQQAAWDGASDSAEAPLYMAVAVSGVWNWRGTIGKRTGPDGGRQDVKGTIADLDRIEWHGRKVTIAYDTNVITQESVQVARMELTKELRRRRAVVHWLHWPANTPQSVNGLDDLLAIQGTARVLELIAAAKPHRDAAPGVRVWSLPELLEARLDPPRPIAEDLLHEGETIAVIGKAKLGKTRITQQLALDISRGHSFLGHHVGKARRVLILDLENRPSAARMRFAKMAGAGSCDGVWLYVPETLSANAITLANNDGPRQLGQLVEDIRPDVLIVDNWRLFLGGDENKTEVVVRGLKALSKLRETVPGLATIIVHHTRKQQQGENPPRLRVDPSAWVEAASGHYAFVAHVDACYGLEREIDREGGDELIVFGGVARNAQPRTLLLEEDNETLLFRVADEEGAAERIFTPVEGGLWAAVRKLDGFTFSDALAYTGTKNRKALASMLRKADSMGLLAKDLNRAYRRTQREGKRN